MVTHAAQFGRQNLAIFLGYRDVFLSKNILEICAEKILWQMLFQAISPILFLDSAQSKGYHIKFNLLTLHRLPYTIHPLT